MNSKIEGQETRSTDEIESAVRNLGFDSVEDFVRKNRGRLPKWKRDLLRIVNQATGSHETESEPQERAADSGVPRQEQGERSS